MTPQPAPIDYEEIIADLEGRLARIESRLQGATQRQDVEAIAKLGKEYNRVQGELETHMGEVVRLRLGHVRPIPELIEEARHAL